jgi:putative membrane protein
MAYPMIRRLAPLAAVAVLGAGCASRDEVTTEAIENTGGETARAVQWEREMPDSQIVDVLLAAHEAEVAEAQLVLTKTQHPEVRAFAQRMVDDHTRLMNDTTALAQRLGVTPMPTAYTEHMRREAAEFRSRLQAMSGTELDQFYVAHQVTEHQKLLDQMDGGLLPSARDPELKSLITAARPTIDDHLQHAKRLQNELGSPPVGLNR